MTPADEAALREIAAKIRTCPTDTEVMDAVVKAHALGRASGCIHQFGVSCFCGDHYVPDGCLSVTSANGWQHSMERCEAPLVTDDQRASVSGVEQRESFARGNLAIDRESGARKTIASVSGERDGCAKCGLARNHVDHHRENHAACVIGGEFCNYHPFQPTDRNAGRDCFHPTAERCLAARAEGKGGCGACAVCCKEWRDRAERLEAKADVMRFADFLAQTLLGHFHKTHEWMPDVSLRNYLAQCVRRTVEAALKGGAKDDGVTLCSAIASWSTPEGGQVCEYDETHEGPHSWEEAQVDRDNAEYDRKRDALKGGGE